jgi:two-component system CheB/CheR fusion protein
LADARTRAQTADSDLVRQLEQELQSTIEELESSNEELKASNEEIMSMNEELSRPTRSWRRRRRLQSLNEEFNTVNNQLHEKIQDLETANNDMANLLNCTDIATVFLDTSFRIKRFTPPTTRLFNLIATDIGRPLGDIVKRFSDDVLLHDAQQLLRDLMSRERKCEPGRPLVRAADHAYRTSITASTAS